MTKQEIEAIILKALKRGIWSKEHLTFPNKYCRQECRFEVMPRYHESEGEWYFYFNPTSYGSSDGYPAHIFWDTVKVKDIGVTWAFTKKELLDEQICNGNN